MKQLQLFKEKTQKSFGGELLKGRRKSQRPLSTKLPVHLVLRSDVSIQKSLLCEFDFVETTIEKFAKIFGVKIYGRAVNTNHLHFVIKFSTRESYINFVRSVSGILAKRLKLHWLTRPFTRVVLWGRDFLRAKKYVNQNQLEAWGIIEYRPRKRRGPAG